MFESAEKHFKKTKPPKNVKLWSWLFCICTLVWFVFVMFSVQLSVFTDESWQKFIRYKLGLVFLGIGIFVSYKVFKRVDKKTIKQVHDYMPIYGALFAITATFWGLGIFTAEVAHKPFTYFLAKEKWEESMIVKYKYSSQRFCGRSPSITFDKFDTLCVSRKAYSEIKVGDEVVIKGRKGYKGFTVEEYLYYH